MSLVSEALRKARAEQRRREIEAGFKPAPILPQSGKPRTIPFGLLLMVSLLSAGLTAALVLLLRPSSPPMAANSEGLMVTPKTTPIPSPTPVNTTPMAPSVQATPRALPMPASQPPTPTPTPTQPSFNPLPQAAPTPSQLPRDFLLEGTVDGVKLRLDYLVYGASRSFASINGRELRKGDEVAGFVLERIDENQVLLQGPGGPVVLRVH